MPTSPTITLIIIIMKNFNRCSSHGYHGSKCRKLVQHAHSGGLHAFTHTLTSTQLQPSCAKRQLSYNRIWNPFFLKVPERVGEQTREKTQQAAGKSVSQKMRKHIEEKIQRPVRELNPHPPTLVISSLGQERMLHRTH